MFHPAVAVPEVVFVDIVFAVLASVAVRAVVFVAPASAADVAEPQVSVHIVVVFVVLLVVSVVLIEVDSSGRPLLALTNIDYYASSSSSAEVFGKESVDSSMGARSNYGHCSILSILDLHHNKTLEHCYNKPNLGHNNVSDTNGLPMDATTNHSRKRDLLLYQEQRKHHSYRASLPHLVAPQMGWAAAEQQRRAEEQSQRLYLPLPLLE